MFLAIVVLWAIVFSVHIEMENLKGEIDKMYRMMNDVDDDYKIGGSR